MERRVTGAVTRAGRLVRVIAAAVVLPMLVGCGAPAEVRSPSPSPVTQDERLGVVVVNRTLQPVGPASGFVIPPCDELYFDPAAAQEVSRRKATFDDWPGGNPPPPIGRLDDFIVRPDEMWFLLVTSFAEPQYFYDAARPKVPGADEVGRPKPAEWPACVGLARLR